MAVAGPLAVKQVLSAKRRTTTYFKKSNRNSTAFVLQIDCGNADRKKLNSVAILY